MDEAVRQELRKHAMAVRLLGGVTCADEHMELAHATADALEALAAQPEPPAPSGDVMERAREVLPKLGMIGAGNRAREATRALAAALQQYGDERVQQERARIGTWLRWVGIGWRKDGDTGKGSLLEGMATLIESDTYADCDDPREDPDA